MSYNFFAYLNRMKYIKRWSLMRSNVSENIMEHSAQTAQLAHALATINNEIFNGSINVDKLTTMALFHESSEVITGDLPTPIKYYNEDIKKAYKALESVANQKLIKMLPEKLQQTYHQLLNPDTDSYEQKLIKAADKLSAYIKCLEEVNSGNTEFIPALNSTEKLLKSYALPEVDYFWDNFISTFSLTLDELS